MGEWNPFLEGKRYSAEELVEVAAQTDRRNCRYFLQKNCTVIEERLQPDTDWGKEDREKVPPSLAEHYPSCFMGEWNPFLEGKRYSAEELVEVAAQTDRRNCRYFESWQPGVSKTSVKRSRQEKLEANRQMPIRK